MSTWAVLAAKQAAIATGFGAGLVPAIGTGSLDGFVIGAAMTGACFTALTAPGRARLRAGVTAAAGLPATAAGGPAATSAAGVTAASADGAEGADRARAALLRRRGVVNTAELRDALERLPPVDYLAASYYERWLGAIEMLATEKGVTP